MPNPDESTEARILHTGEGKVLVPLTVQELRELIEQRPRLRTLHKLEKALELLELNTAREKFKNDSTGSGGKT